LNKPLQKPRNGKPRFEKLIEAKNSQTYQRRELLRCFKDIEEFEAKIQHLAPFFEPLVAADMDSIPSAATLNDRVDKLSANISKQLAFYSLELGALVKSRPQNNQ